MITRENYLEKIKEVDFSKMSEGMQKSKAFFEEVTDNATSWELYESEPELKKTIDLYFVELTEELKLLTKKPSSSKSGKKLIKRTVKPSQEGKKITSTDDRTAKIAFELALKNHLNLVNRKGIVQEDLPISMWATWDLVETISTQKDKWDQYAKSPKQMKLIDDFFSKVNELTVDRRSKKAEKKEVDSKQADKKDQEGNSKKVEHISPELRFMKSFINMDGKKKDRHKIRLFINRVQRAIQERRITKKSKYAKQIMDIQEKLIAFHGRFKNDKEELPISFNEETKNYFLKLIAEEDVLLSVKYIKSYINLQGKLIPNKKALSLFNRISKAVEKGNLSSGDKYWKQIETILNHLESFVKKNPNEGILKVEPRTLNGLNGIVTGCECEPEITYSFESKIPKQLDINSLTDRYLTSGKTVKDNRFMMSSEDLMGMSFKHVGLKDKWLNFIGDPEVGFRIAIFGKPKMGKSYLMIEFAGYLAANHGRVLYIAKEEGKSATLKKKLKDTAATHPNFMVSNYIPENLGDFDYAFYDSTTKLGLTPDNLMAINAAFKNTASIEIHQVTKDGKARGLNDFVHDVDSIIEVYEKGKARQDGRFNQGGELDFFDENAA